MKTIASFALLSLVSCATVSSQAPQNRAPATANQQLSLYLGQRTLFEDDYEPVEEQPTLGLEYANEKTGSVVGWEIGLMGSYDDSKVMGFDVEARTAEIYGGVRKSFGTDKVRPYVGGGLSVINSEVEVSGIGKDDDTSLAGYAHGGVAFDVTQAFSIGLDLRFLFGSDMDIAGTSTDADYGQLALVLGFSF